MIPSLISGWPWGVRLGLSGDDALTHATNEAGKLTPDDLNDPDLRLEVTSTMASRVASIPAVRQALQAYQRAFAKTPPDDAIGAVLDGRDIGTVILPDADIKFYCDADIEICAKRRHKELISRGERLHMPTFLPELGIGTIATWNVRSHHSYQQKMPSGSIREILIDQMVEQAIHLLFNLNK